MSNGRGAMVRNAADPNQVKHAARKERRREEEFRAALRAVMATPAGRLVMWSLLESAGIYRSVWDMSGSRTYYNAGRQDYGHELLAKLLEADPELYLAMEREMRNRAAFDARENAAVQMGSAEGGQ